MADNPYANTSNATFWAQGYNSAQQDGAGLFGKPPDGLTSGAVDTWKEGWKAGKTDAKNGILVEQDTSDGSSPQATPAAPSTPAPPAARGGGSSAQVWNIVLDGKRFDHVSTEGAQAAIKKVVEGLNRRVDSARNYQIEWHKCASSTIMNWIIETAPGGRYEPDQAVWSTLDKEIAGVQSAADSGKISDAAAKVEAASAAVAKAVADWYDFLDHFEEGGKSVIEGLGDVAKVSIKFEAILIDIATDGAGGAVGAAAIGAGDGGLSEMVDQWVDINEGKQKDFDWNKIGEEAILSAVIDGATHGLSEKWAETVAEKAPALVGAKTELLERISSQFIDSETGAKFTAAQMAVKLEPLWGKIVQKLTEEPVKKALEVAIKAQAADAEALASQLAAALDDSAWEAAIEGALTEAGVPKG